MEDYNGVQENYRDKNKDRIQKQLQYGTQNRLHHDHNYVCCNTN